MSGPLLSDVGEFELIRRVAARLPGGPALLLGPGDDAAVVAAPGGSVVATTDMLVEGRHFRLDWSSPYDVGRKAAAQNLADIAAMGASPTALLVALGAPPTWPVADAEALADGLAAECAAAGASVAGGDVVRSGVLVLGVTALGDLAGRTPVTRGGAQAGDDLLLVGSVGEAEAGLRLLRRNDSGLLARHGALVAAHRSPRPQYGVALALARAGATAMIDVSDGLLADAGHVARASGVRLVLSTEHLVGDAVRAAAHDLGVDPLDLVLRGGDDHAYLVAVPAGTTWPDGGQRTDAPGGGQRTDAPGGGQRADAPCWVRRIGTVTPGAGVAVDGAEPPPGRGGHDHFAEDQ